MGGGGGVTLQSATEPASLMLMPVAEELRPSASDQSMITVKVQTKAAAAVIKHGYHEL